MKFTDPRPCVIRKPLAKPAPTGEISDGLLMNDDTATLKNGVGLRKKALSPAAGVKVRLARRRR